ncbi:MAG TPA: hypothetical protein DEB42_05050 [Jeotgalicoccus sp.]|nr:hypothetical protein [Jeotgalicoccus sp.]
MLTPEILSLLKKYDAKAIFFLLGTKMNLFPGPFGANTEG